ncbi:acetolactate synthase-1/2/3 large subunit [Parafrankia irregularis]|uniref:Acetolactate synthase-1/2/3 large subunit n=1 Tax=Parafrankia irregularis TaxID=795642 RepID=A0A0S4QUY5_9ACTN|nr:MULTISPECIES: thiamine pyrophosphate-binding protein [Parafrankia]MBE3199957.1 thiamine pyrophosphate-binding protein [Parafrankia sp. CH37]CUU59299.1 acetolactate synthase-1/2/3 large subunit [Parafrankia irregularis]
MGKQVDGGELVARTLRSFGVEVAFGLHGGHLNSLLLGFARNGIRVVDTRHETVAVNAADGFARTTGRLGVAFATAAAGFSNALGGLAVAYADRSPVLVLTSSPPLRDAEMNAAQGFINQVAVAAPMARWAHRVTVVEEIPRLVGFAIRKALAGAPGPVVVDIPIDVLFTPVDEDTVHWGGGPKLAAPPAPAPAAVADALRVLRAARRPAIIVGGGARQAGDRLVAFAERSGIPVFSQTGSYGVIPPGHPLSGGGAGSLAMVAHTGLEPPDALLLLGARTGAFSLARSGRIIPDDATIVHVDADAAEIGRILPAEVGITADAGETLAAFLADEQPWPDRGGWARAVTALHRHPRPHAGAETETAGRLHPYHAARELVRALPPGTDLIADGGEVIQWLSDVLHDGDLRSASGFGGYLAHLGIGFGFAIGRRIADQSRRPVLVTGDGAFGFHASEIDTMVRHHLPVVIVVFTNEVWGSSIHGQQLHYGDEAVVASRLADTDYDQVAVGYGGHGERVRRIDDLAPAIRRAFAVDGPTVINVAVADVMHPVAPMVIDVSDDPDVIVIPYYDNLVKRK